MNEGIVYVLTNPAMPSMVKKLLKMSRKGKEENEGLTPKQKELVAFLENASNKSKE